MTGDETPIPSFEQVVGELSKPLSGRSSMAFLLTTVRRSFFSI